MSKKQVWLWVFVLFIAALAVSGVSATMTGRLLVNPVAIAGVAGSAVAVFIIPGVIPLVLWGARRFRACDAKGPLVLWITLLLVVSFPSLSVATNETQLPKSKQLGSGKDFKFRPKGCEYSVTFPRRPTIKTLYVPNLGNVQQAEYSDISSATLMRAECVTSNRGSLALLRTRKGLLDAIQEYVDFQGLRFATYEFEVTNLGSVGKARGYKRLSNIHVTYETIWHVGNNSAMNLLVGGPSKSYPSSNVVRFIRSVSH